MVSTSQQNTPMILLLYGFGLLVVLGGIVTAVALISAKRGFEDESGYHTIDSELHESAGSTAPTKPFSSDGAHLPPMLPTI